MSADMWGWIFGIIGVLLLASGAMAFGKRDPLVDKAGGDVIPVDSLPTYRRFPPGVYSAILIRQSGNLHRDLGTFPSAEAALREAAKSFRRAKVEDVRITHVGETELAAYRAVYNFKGRAEGKKFAGVRLTLVSRSAPEITDYVQVTPGGLRLRLSGMDRDGDQHNVRVDGSCANCGSDDVVTSDAEFHCPACGTVLATREEAAAIHKDLAVRYLTDAGMTIRSVDAEPTFIQRP